MGGLVAGPDGNLWFTEIGHIGRLTPAGAVTEFALASSDSKPGVIVAGPDGNLWFTEPSAKALGRITSAGVVTQFPLPAGDTYPVGLTSGPDGALWYTRSATSPSAGGGPPNTGTPGVIGRMSTNGAATEFELPTATSAESATEPLDIVNGDDGALWFDTGISNAGVGGILGASWIGRITTSGKASIVYSPTTLVDISGLAAGSDHNLWFTEINFGVNTGGPPALETSSVGRLTPSGTVTFYSLPSSTSLAPDDFVAGPDGNLWFAASGGKLAPHHHQRTGDPLPFTRLERRRRRDVQGTWHGGVVCADLSRHRLLEWNHMGH